MPLTKCKNCQFLFLPQFAGSNHECHRNSPRPYSDDDKPRKAYWPIVNIETDGCGDGEAKPAKK